MVFMGFKQLQQMLQDKTIHSTRTDIQSRIKDPPVRLQFAGVVCASSIIPSVDVALTLSQRMAALHHAEAYIEYSGCLIGARLQRSAEWPQKRQRCVNAGAVQRIMPYRNIKFAVILSH